MKTTGIMGAAMLGLLIVAGGWATAASQQEGIGRTELQRHDLSLGGRELVQVRVDFAPGAMFPRHAHPGEEVVNVLDGSLEYHVEGRPPVRLEAGDVLFIPSGAIHEVRNLGRGTASELATYIVEKGKPLLTLARSDSLQERESRRGHPK